MTTKEKIVSYMKKNPGKWFRYCDLHKNTWSKLLDIDLPFLPAGFDRRMRELAKDGMVRKEYTTINGKRFVEYSAK
jgi:hypothetical protein